MRVVEDTPWIFRMVDWPKLQGFAILIALVGAGFALYGARRTVLVCGPEPEPQCRIETTWLVGSTQTREVPLSALRSVTIDSYRDDDAGMRSRVALVTETETLLVGRPSVDVETVDKAAALVQGFLDSHGQTRVRFTNDERKSSLTGLIVVILLILVFGFFAEVTTWELDRTHRTLTICHHRPLRRREVRISVDDIETIVREQATGDGWDLGTIVTRDGRRIALYPFTFGGFYVPLYRRHVATLERALSQGSYGHRDP